ncbi:hypothetical protein PF008_g14677 [Phytophthora fragariae]|uniref:Uncharacterized protein n=1 Tax=Phytophthora fragariae TaxID=53985 RepID=A0A6G0RHR3_9STRA|nr:hypothetical protein PF008_g14677 [Phytophthora fragariae]
MEGPTQLGGTEPSTGTFSVISGRLVYEKNDSSSLLAAVRSGAGDVDGVGVLSKGETVPGVPSSLLDESLEVLHEAKSSVATWFTQRASTSSRNAWSGSRVLNILEALPRAPAGSTADFKVNNPNPQDGGGCILLARCYGRASPNQTGASERLSSDVILAGLVTGCRPNSVATENRVFETGRGWYRW